MYLYDCLLRVASLWDNSAKKLIAGRRGNIHNLEKFRQSNTGKLIWFHCASLGEYEQGRPLMEKIKIHHPEYLVALTFYSPSGYDVIKDSDAADWVGYMERDTMATAINFIDTLKPNVAIFIKNEFWWNHLDVLHTQKVPVHIISSTIRQDHYFIRYGSSYFSSIISKLTSIGLVDKASQEVLKKTFPHLDTYVSGDMRVARVKVVSSTASLPWLEKLIGDHKTIVYGSIWSEDISAIKSMMERYPQYVHLCFPHSLEETNIKHISKELSASLIVDKKDLKHGDRVLVTTMGILSRSYKYANIAYVGGGYGDGIHNIIEPLVFEIPVVVGGNIRKSSEALQLANTKALTVLSHKPTVEEIPYYHDNDLDEIGNIARDFLEQHVKSVEITYDKIFGESQL